MSPTLNVPGLVFGALVADFPASAHPLELCDRLSDARLVLSRGEYPTPPGR